MFNGISKSPDNSELLVVVCAHNGVQTFKITEKGLEKDQFILLHHGADNIEYDERSNAYYLGSIPRVFETLEMFKAS